MTLRPAFGSILLSWCTFTLTACNDNRNTAENRESANKETSQQASRSLSAEQVAEALGYGWSVITLPETKPGELLEVGPIIEFGDGSETIEYGSLQGVKGGSRVDYFLKPEEDSIDCVIRTQKNSGILKLEQKIQYDELADTDTLVTLNGVYDYDQNIHNLKYSRKSDAPIGSHKPLLPHEFGVRLSVKSFTRSDTQ